MRGDKSILPLVRPDYSVVCSNALPHVLGQSPFFGCRAAAAGVEFCDDVRGTGRGRDREQGPCQADKRGSAFGHGVTPIREQALPPNDVRSRLRRRLRLAEFHRDDELTLVRLVVEVKLFDR